jgi:Zn finger protein HypA/HybF involved in hydrogenase expression
MKHWTLEEIELIKKEASTGKSYKEIGELIGRTGKAIAMRMQKLGFVFEDFYKKPIKFCECCSEEIKNVGIKYCSSSCAAKINNKRFPKRRLLNKTDINQELKVKKLEKCQNCKISLEDKAGNIFCSKSCMIDYTKKNINKTNKICLNCGENYIGHWSSKYCSMPCSVTCRNKTKEQNILQNDNSLTSRSYKNFLINKHGAKCMECGWDKINPVTQKCPIELEHIDGNSQNNKLENLKLLCPNCHSLTPTYKALNKGNGHFNRMKRYKEGKSY